MLTLILRQSLHAEALAAVGLRFTGVVKTATRRFPMKYLSEVELSGKGDMRSLVCQTDICQLGAVV